MTTAVSTISFDFELYKDNSYLVHNFHPYPAKFIPKIPNELIGKLTEPGDWVMDPFCGSGTTLVEAKLLDRHAIGLDINPIACLVSRVKTRPLNDDQFHAIREIVLRIEMEAQDGADYDVPRFHNLDHWFQKHVQRELAVIRHHIVSVADSSIREFLQVAMSAILVRVSNQDSDTRYAAVKKVVPKGQPSKLFRSRIVDMIDRLKAFSRRASVSTIIVRQGDSRKLSKMPGTVSAVITSPPYMNSFDYYLYHKHRMQWLGLDFREVQKAEFGSRNLHNDQNKGLEEYIAPLQSHALESKNVLRPKGYYCAVIGDAILKGEVIRMNDVFDSIFLNAGFQKAREITYDQRKYTRTFTRNLKTIHKNTYILVYQN